MGAEILLYGYGLVCVSMLVFNLIYAVYLRAGDRRLQKRTDAVCCRIEEQLKQIREERMEESSQVLRERQLAWMRRRLSRVNYLLALDHFLAQQNIHDDVFQMYLERLQPVFLYLATVYWKREETQAAYFCHFLARHQPQRNTEMDSLQQVVLSYLKKNSLYCRINALKALCGFGSPETLVKALLELGRGPGIQLHEKVVTEALLAYTGNAEELAESLWKKFDQFSLQIQRSVLDYIRFRSGDYRRPMGEILRDTGRNKELRIAAIRYFGRYPDPAAEAILLDFVRNRDPLYWEYAAVSATALARYPGQKTVDALFGAMHSPNWYIRYNASASLEAHGLSYEEMLQILAGDDRYAREMLNYRLEAKRLGGNV